MEHENHVLLPYVAELADELEVNVEEVFDLWHKFVLLGDISDYDIFLRV